MAEGPVALLTPRRGVRWGGQWRRDRVEPVSLHTASLLFKSILVEFSVTTDKCWDKEKPNILSLQFYKQSHQTSSSVSTHPDGRGFYLAECSPLFKLQFRCLPFYGASSGPLTDFTFLNIIHTLLLTPATSYCTYLNLFLLLTRRHSLSTELLLFHLRTSSTWD